MKRPTEKLRVLDGTGRIWDDCFADARLLFMPPATAALLVLLSRNHNYTAEKILAINERGLYANPPPTDEKARRAQDDAIFHRARLVNCGFFAKIVLYDYVGGILGMTRDGSPFRLNLVESMRESDHAFAPTGEGNQISCEFNLLYRWHASTSATDAKWIDGVFQKLLGGKPYNTVTPDDFKKAAGRFMRPDEDLRKWTFGGLQRDATTGRFRDEELAAILMDATEAPAHAFGARRTPEALRVVEIMTIEQGREWGVCTLNEFRKFFGLKPYANFREWNPDPEIYNAAQALYRDIDNLELHVGMQAEDTKPPMSGAGLCPSYTMSRAILADAVVLCRSDPYLTTEFTPYNVTSWGYQDCVVNPKDGSHGGMLTKLMFRHLEGQFNSGDAYAHFPLLVPSAMRAAMEKRGDPAIKKYSWARPKTAGALVTTSSKDGVRAVLDRPDLFVSGYNDRVRALVKGMVIDRHLVQDAMVRDMVKYRWEDDFAQITGELIRAGSIARPGFGASQIDIVQDVINLVPVYFLAHDILGLPLKTAANPGGVYRPAKLYDLFANVGNYVLFHKNSEEEWASRERAAHCADMVIGEIGSNLERLSYGIFSVGGLIDTITDYFSSTTDRSGQFLTGLLADAKRERLSHAELAACLFAEVVPSAAQFASAIAHIVDFYLDDQQATARAGLVSIAAARGVEPNANEKLLSYAKNALRANPPVSATYRVARANAVVDGKQVKAGQRVLANISTGSADQFGDGSEMYTFGAEGLLNAKFFDRMAPAVLRVIFGLRNVRRAPGLSGQVPKFVQDLEGTPQVLYIGKDSGVSPWPTRLMVQYDS